MKKTANNRGFYEFADGTTAYFNGLSTAELRKQVKLHGAVIKFIAM
jgi:hypothetical protein